MSDARPRQIIVTRVNFVWYALALLPIAALFFGAANGYISPLFGLIGLFAALFWLFSLLSALYLLFRKPKNRTPRQ